MVRLARILDEIAVFLKVSAMRSVYVCAKSFSLLMMVWRNKVSSKFISIQ